MGSQRRDSSRPSKAGTSTSKSIKSHGRLPTSKPRRKPNDFDALLERFSDALSIVATATRSLSHAQDDFPSIPGHDIGEDIITLEHGVKLLRAVYEDLDVAIPELHG